MIHQAQLTKVKLADMTYRWITLFKECCIDVIETDLVIQPCGDQGKHEGQEVDEDGDAS